MVVLQLPAKKKLTPADFIVSQIVNNCKMLTKKWIMKSMKRLGLKIL
ncbi:hypothetical protein OROGR_017876 [Orobanche gracilis]